MQIIRFIQAYWHILLPIVIVIAVVVAAYLDWQFSHLQLFGPRDTLGNGITVGLAKAFDNRSLALRIERLSNSLAQMKVVDQKVTDNIGKFQGQGSTLSAQTLSVDIKAGVKANAAAAGSGNKSDGTAAVADASKSAAAADPGNAGKPEVTLAAGDILNEQLNLASQILNLQTLYERSLTDRLIDGHARLQTVLGFQVSITPPAGFENCVAIVEVAVRMKTTKSDADGNVVPGDPLPVSLVAMIPQEKTYNAQSISTTSKSIGGSAVASVMTLGYTSKGEARQIFIHRDSDTVAFERDPRNAPTLFPDGKAAAFGWEFRPVLDRKTVSAGMRQMLAVVALPAPDASEDPKESVLEIKTRSYWRRYDATRQTSTRKWHWWPGAIDGAQSVDSEIQELRIPNTFKLQNELEPKVENITWVDSGSNRATVIVKGRNFFPGTKVVAGGKVHREEDNNLTLKSDQALEFETTLAAIASGDSVLSGRFGPSLQLNLSKDRLPVRSLYITRAAIKQSRRAKDLRISIDVKGLDAEGNDKDLEVAHLEGLPEPVLFIGNEPVPMPYDYWPLPPNPPRQRTGTGTGTGRGSVPTAVTGTGTVAATTPATGTGTASGAAATPATGTGTASGAATTPATGAATGAGSGGSGSGTATSTGSSAQPFSFSYPSTMKSIRVEAWIPSRIPVTRNSPVMFRIPFCGLDYQASQPLRFFEPTVTRMGGDGTNTAFRISHSLGSEKSVSVELDKVYDNTSPELVKLVETEGDYRLTVPNTLVAQYQNLVVWIEGAEPYVVPVPAEEKPKVKPTLDLNSAPPKITKGSIGPAEWSGTNLGMVTAATLVTQPTAAAGNSGAPASPNRTPTSFTVYDGGKKVVVYFSDTATTVPGKAEVEFQIGANAADTLRAPLFIAPALALSNVSLT